MAAATPQSPLKSVEDHPQPAGDEAELRAILCQVEAVSARANKLMSTMCWTCIADALQHFQLSVGSHSFRIC